MENKSNFNQAFWLAIGQFGAYALAFVSAAILSRYFDKTQYGTYKQILYVYTTLQSLFTVGLPSAFAYFIPKMTTPQQKTLVNSLNRLFVLLGLAFSILLFALSTPLAHLLKNPELSVGLKIFSPFPLFTLPTLGVEGIYTALKNTKTIAWYNMLAKLLMLIFIVVPVVFMHTDYKGAIIGWGIASFLMFLVAMYLKNRPFFNVKAEYIPNLYKSVLDYSLPLMGAFIAGFFINSADQFYISCYYGTETFADYANGCLSIPFIAMITNSVRGVLVPIFSKADKEGTISNAMATYRNAVLKMAVLIIPMIIYCILFAKYLMVFLYGQRYEISGSYMQCYTIREFSSLIPYFAILLALGLSKIYMIMHIAGVIYIWTLDLFIVHFNLSSLLIVTIHSSFYIFCTIFAIIYLIKKKHLNITSGGILRKITITLIHSIICILITYLCIHLLFYSVQFNSANSFIILAISSIIFGILLILTGKFFRINYLESFELVLKRR